MREEKGGFAPCACHGQPHFQETDKTAAFTPARILGHMRHIMVIRDDMVT